MIAWTSVDVLYCEFTLTGWSATFVSHEKDRQNSRYFRPGKKSWRMGLTAASAIIYSLASSQPLQPTARDERARLEWIHILSSPGLASSGVYVGGKATCGA